MKPTFKIILTATIMAVLASCSPSSKSDGEKSSEMLYKDTLRHDLQSDSVSAKSAEPDSFPNSPERDTLTK